MARNKKDEQLAIVLGKRINELVGDRKHSAVAEQIGVRPNTFWGYLNGMTMPSYKVLLKLADHFDVTVDWLLKGQESLMPRDRLEAEVISDLRTIPDRRVAEQAAEYVHFLAKGQAKTPSGFREVWVNIVKSNDLGSLGKRLRYVRETELGMDPDEFAVEIGITAGELRDIETDRTRPRAAALTAYNKKFGCICPLDILLGGGAKGGGL